MLETQFHYFKVSLYVELLSGKAVYRVVMLLK